MKHPTVSFNRPQVSNAKGKTGVVEFFCINEGQIGRPRIVRGFQFNLYPSEVFPFL